MSPSFDIFLRDSENSHFSANGTYLSGSNPKSSSASSPSTSLPAPPLPPTLESSSSLLIYNAPLSLVYLLDPWALWDPLMSKLSYNFKSLSNFFDFLSIDSASLYISEPLTLYDLQLFQIKFKSEKKSSKCLYLFLSKFFYKRLIANKLLWVCSDPLAS